MLLGGNWRNLLDNMTQQVRDTFGQAVTYTRHKTGEVFEILAVFDITYNLSEAGGQIGANIPVKELDIRLSDIGNQPPRQGDSVLIDGAAYQVNDVKQSTSGMVKAVLREVK